MNEFLVELPAFMLFGSILYFWILVVLLVIVLHTFDNYQNGYGATVSVVIFIILTKYWGTFDIFTLVNLKAVGIYIVIGLAFAGLRTYFFARKAEDEQDAVNRLKQLRFNVFRWWFLWPVSLLNWFLYDLIRDFFNVVYDKLEKKFVVIFNKGLKKEYKYNPKKKDGSNI